jgi:hypothetical protein
MEMEMEVEIERRVAQRLEEERLLRLQRAMDSDEEVVDSGDGGGTVSSQVALNNCRWSPLNYDSPASDEPYVAP